MIFFGLKIKELRARRGITQKKMADYFGLIWDEAEELKGLALISHPRVVVDTAGLNPKATELANLMARHVHDLDEGTLERLLAEIKGRGRSNLKCSKE